MSNSSTSRRARVAALADRVTGGDHRVYGDIQTAFDGAEEVAAAARRVADADEEAFERLYREAGGRQESNTRDTGRVEDIGKKGNARGTDPAGGHEDGGEKE